MESPVTVERLDARAIKNTSSPSFYDGLENLKGVGINTNSLTFKSVNTRFMQLVDGMDNSSPALNFAIGNLLGMSELDIATVEILLGVSSALYGANAFNGIMFMRSRSPFEDQGISFSYKKELTSQESVGDKDFYEYNLRMAPVFSDKFAAKATLSVLEGTEWYATNYRNTSDGKYVAGDRGSDINYDGVNVYGDVLSRNINGIAQILVGLGLFPSTDVSLIPDVNVSRTGYREVDLIDYKARSVKFGAALHYRPFGDDRLEVIWNSKIGRGSTIYQGGQRYSIKNFFLEQHRLEVKGEIFFVRGYFTNEDAGDSYNTLFAALNINREWKSHETWFGKYVAGYAGDPTVELSSLVAPEKVTAFELGYRAILDVDDTKVSIDLHGYYNNYKGFISTKTVLVPLYGQAGDNELSLLALQNGGFKPFNVYTNYAADINSYRAGIASR